MKNKLTALISVVLLVLSCISLKPVCINMIGDSTMADKPTEGNPERGWGQLLFEYFKADVQIFNHARNGRSSKSFIDEGRWQAVLDSLKPGDYVIIQFGHNDEKEQDPKQYTDPATTFKQNLEKFIRETREKSAIPIMCTPIMRRRFDGEGKFYDTHGRYPDAVREVAITTKTALLDMHQKSEQLIISLGEEGSKKLFLFIEPGLFPALPEGKEDNTHFSEYGAYQMAGLAVEGIRGVKPSISGSRSEKNIRPTINSYMYGNALAISKIARMAKQPQISEIFFQKATLLKGLIQDNLWDAQADFFKVRFEKGQLSDARELIGYIPWYFNLPDSGFESAWLQIKDPQGFEAPYGLTTAEQNHPKFRTHGVGSCEWDGAVWPFATSQTLTGMANLFRNYHQTVLTREHYFNVLLTYAKSHQKNGTPYVGEYLDEKTGAWLKGDNPRSRFYNHSTFCDLIISGLIGIYPNEENIIIISPLIPENKWEWFTIQDVPYKNFLITVVWDKDGEKYQLGRGLFLFVNRRLKAHSLVLQRIETEMKF